MNVLIAEDEALAAERLHGLLLECDPMACVVDQVDSVVDIVAFFKSGRSADLILLDIQLADGKCFEVFDKVNIEVPIIFTTAYDQYALQAFRFHSIDYILKPVQRADLEAALVKLRKMSNPRTLNYEEIALVRTMISGVKRGYKERFIIKSGNKFLYKHVTDVALFFADGKATYLLIKKDHRQFLIDHTLEELDQSLDPKHFFRISRKHIISIDVIAEVRGLISTRLEIKLNQPFDQPLYVSRERAQDFKKWLDR
jgi:DNA-binding LytR/AlgR family response regulator